MKSKSFKLDRSKFLRNIEAILNKLIKDPIRYRVHISNDTWSHCITYKFTAMEYTLFIYWRGERSIKYSIENIGSELKEVYNDSELSIVDALVNRLYTVCNRYTFNDMQEFIKYN